MGWADCGDDSVGRPIGYAFAATCDHDECAARINRGLDYACGGMHGILEVGCENYFCHDHLTYMQHPHDNRSVQVCVGCGKEDQDD